MLKQQGDKMNKKAYLVYFTKDQTNKWQEYNKPLNKNITCHYTSKKYEIISSHIVKEDALEQVKRFNNFGFKVKIIQIENDIN